MYGAIKSINTLGPTHLLNILYPKIDTILQYLTRDIFVTENIDSVDKNCDVEKEEIVISDSMVVDQPSQMSMMKLSLSIPQFGNYGEGNFIPSSIFSEISNTNVVNYKKEAGKSVEQDKLIASLTKTKKFNKLANKKAFYVNYVLKV